MKKYLIPILFLFFCIKGLSQVPETMSFQGILTDTNGDPVAETAFTLEFEMYDALTAGTKVWGPETHSVTPVGGVYTVILGSNGEPLATSVDFGGQYYLQVKVNGELITPRFQLTTSPYAFTAREVMGTDNVFPATGNVGIGNASPATALDVSGTVTATSFAGEGATLTGLNATNINTGTLADARLEPTVDLTGLNVSGNVGIGNTSPATALDVTGTITATGLTVNGDVTATSFSGDGSALTNLPPTSPVWSGSGDISYSGGNVGIGTVSPSTALDVSGTVNATSYIGDGSGLTNLASSPWTLAAPDVYYDLGKVGIGTSTPTAELEVNVSTPGDGTSIRIENPSASGFSALSLKNDNRSYALAVGGSTASVGANNFYILDGQSGTARMSVTSGGDVGIGTTSPATKLEVNGAVTATAFAGSLAATNLTGTVADARLESTVDVTRLNTTGGLHVGGTSDPGADNMIVDGMIGIGITPTYPLEIESTSERAIDVNQSYAGSMDKYGILSFVDAAGTGTRYGLWSQVNNNTASNNSYGSFIAALGSSTNKYGIYTLGEDRNYFGSPVGIGVDPPVSMLDVNGTVTATAFAGSLAATNLTGTVADARLESTVDVTRLNTTGGLHVGGTSDPGADNLLVDGDLTTTGPISFTDQSTGLTMTDATGLNYFSAPGGFFSIDATSPANTAVIFEESGSAQYQIGYLPASNYFSIAETGVGEHFRIEDGGKTFITGSTSATNSTLNVYSDDGSGFVTSIEADYGGTVGLMVFKQEAANIGLITATGGVISYGTFTGSHLARSNESMEPGQIVILKGTQSFQNGMDGEPVYNVTISSEANDPKVLGTYFSEDPTDKEIQIISAVGNGDVWVVDKGENLIAGDYLITSDVRGHAMKDTGEFELSYVFARVAENVDWSEESETIQGVKHKKISIFYETFTLNHKAEMLEKELDDLRREVEALKDLLIKSN